jgi:hypothetical protein
MRIRVKGCDPVAPVGARESVPQGHLIVAHYEVVGKALEMTPSRRGTIEPSVRGSHTARQPIDRPLRLRDGSLLKNTTHHFVVGYYQMVPSSFAPPSLRCGAAFVLRAHRSSQSKGGLRATADRPGRDSLRMVLSL